MADTGNHRIQRFTAEGQHLGRWGGHGSEPGRFDMPWGLTIDEEGDVFVADWRNDRVQKLTAEGEPLLVIGGSGAGDGEFNRPAGVAVDEHGDIYVADRGNNRVQLFAHTGRYVQQFRGDATLSAIGRRYILANQKTLRLREMANLEEQRLMRAPCSVRVDGRGLMYVPDLGSHRVQVYKKEAYVLEPDEIHASADGADALHDLTAMAVMIGFAERRRELLEAELQRMAAELPMLGVERSYLTGDLAAGEVEVGSALDLVLVRETEEPFRRRADFFASHLQPQVATRFWVYTPDEFESLAEDDPVLRRALADNA